MRVRSLVSEPIRWPRVGAMSAAFNLHGVAAALLLMAATAPPSTTAPASPVPVLSVQIVEPPPIEAPAVPVAPARASTPAPERRPVPRLAEAQPVPSLPGPPTRTAPMADPLPLAGTIGTAQVAAAAADRGVAYERVREPRYPAVARIRGIEGETVLRVLVAADGQVRSVTVAASSGHRELDQAALAAVRTWRFQPAIEQGRTVAAWVQVPVVFRLH